MFNRNADRRMTLEQLERDAWGEPEYGSYLVTTCHRLRRKPIGSFSVEDLRIMLGQGIGVAFLLPLALDTLARKPLASGHYYPGDLLASVLRLPASVWQEHSELRERVEAVLRTIGELPEELSEPLATFHSNLTGL